MSNARRPPGAVLFDLDGTLLDTAPDLVEAFRASLLAEGLTPCPEAEIRPFISGGARAMLSYWLVRYLDRQPAQPFPHPNRVSARHEALLETLLERMLDHYQSHLARHTVYFSGMELVLAWLEARAIPWGIVTNKTRRFTDPLAEAFGLDRRCGAIISGDTLPECKPHPLPLLEACRRLGREAAACAYVGDSPRDIEAGRRAGMTTLAALYGYIHEGEDVAAWGADYQLQRPVELIEWLEERAWR